MTPTFTTPLAVWSDDKLDRLIAAAEELIFVETIRLITPTYIDLDGIDYELTSRECWDNEIWSAMFGAGCDTSPEGIRKDDLIAAAIECGLYNPELSLVLLANLPHEEDPS